MAPVVAEFQRICETCRNPFITAVRYPSIRPRRTCSRSCAARLPRRHQPLSERFWRYVRRTPTCWLWTGLSTPNGAGILPVRDQGRVRRMTAAQVAWELHVGPVPAGRRVWRRCRRPACVRPDHLVLVRRGRPSGVTVPDTDSVRRNALLYRYLRMFTCHLPPHQLGNGCMWPRSLACSVVGQSAPLWLRVGHPAARLCSVPPTQPPNANYPPSRVCAARCAEVMPSWMSSTCGRSASRPQLIGARNARAEGGHRSGWCNSARPTNQIAPRESREPLGATNTRQSAARTRSNPAANEPQPASKPHGGINS
jgi:hypothetical protein